MLGGEALVFAREVYISLGELYFLFGYGTCVKLHGRDQLLLVRRLVVIWYDLVAADQDVAAQPQRMLDLVDEVPRRDRYDVDVGREQTPDALEDLDEAAPLAVDGYGTVVQTWRRFDPYRFQEEGGRIQLDHT